jgi:hypothetical protein
MYPCRHARPDNNKRAGLILKSLRDYTLIQTGPGIMTVDKVRVDWLHQASRLREGKAKWINKQLYSTKGMEMV